MAADLRLEIIYFKQNADIELEFGLHGEYPMRLLTASSDEPRDFLKKLKRAVGRSTIILTIGGFSDGLPQILGKSVGLESSAADREKYGISEPGGEIIMPNTAVPIVINGIYGGCVLESGAQSIIMLSENRKPRKKIVSSLLVPYIKEHYKFYGR